MPQTMTDIILRFIQSTGTIILLGWLFISIAANHSFADSEQLVEIQDWIIDHYPSVKHIDKVTLAGALKQSELGQNELGQNILLLDVRERNEYNISHLPNAIRVDPDMSRKEFMKLFGDSLEHKTVVFYCSVGRRSSKLAERVEGDLKNSGVESYNLEHGIFGWHNQNLPLITTSTSTDYVHPYNKKWGKLIQRKDFIRYKSDD